VAEPTNPDDNATQAPAAARAGGAGAQGASTTPAAPATPDPLLGAPVAVDIGWTVAVLFGCLPSDEQPAHHLPTEHELPRTQRIDVELVRLRCLLTRLAAQVPAIATQLPGVPAAPPPPNQAADPDAETATSAVEDPFHVAFRAFNIAMLKALACVGRELELAYELGRSLRDTANPPLPGDRTDQKQLDALKGQFARSRVSALQEWLATLDPHLPPDSAAIVGASLGRWSDFYTIVFDPSSPGSLRRTNFFDFRRTAVAQTTAVDVSRDLQFQGDAWIDLLTGAESTTGLLTPEAYVAAGEAALSRTVRIVKRVALHYWFALFLLAAALAGILTVSALYLGGAGKVWTQISAIAGALGVTAKAIGTSVARLSSEAERPIYHLEELDAMAWAVTTLPEVRVNNRGVRALRRSGIQRSAPLGHV